MTIKTKLDFKNNLSQLGAPEPDSFLLFDSNVVEANPEVQVFVNGFSQSLGQSGGEACKNLTSFPSQVNEILKAWKAPIHRKSTLVVLGGGSLGDFGGFLASTLKRGIRLRHIPSTWLAAVDSAHGGKNALNVNGVKNQLGTFFFPERVTIVRELLEAQPTHLGIQAMGEFLKMGLLSSKDLLDRMFDSDKLGEDWLWKFLKPCVLEKYKIVEQDPYETQKIRQWLNLGHTFGHIFEAHFGLSHGESVMQGLFFTLQWSLKKKILSAKNYEAILNSFEERWGFSPAVGEPTYQPIPFKVAEDLLMSDKKKNKDSSLNFVFLKKIGKPRVHKVEVADLLKFSQETGWVR